MNGLQQVFRRSPAVMGTIVIYCVAFVLTWAGALDPILKWIAFSPSLAFSQPWTLLTGALIPLGGIFVILFAMLWLGTVGTTVESELGPRRWILTMVGFAVATNLVYALYALALPVSQGPVISFSLTDLCAVLTCLWAARRPKATVMLFGMIPLEARWIAAIAAIVTFFTKGTAIPLLGVFALLPLAVAWFWASQKLPVAYPTDGGSSGGSAKLDRKQKKKEAEEFAAFQEDVRKREIERAERERLKKLFEDSLDEPSR